MQRWLAIFFVLFCSLSGQAQISFFTSPSNYSTHDNTSGAGGSAPFAIVAADFDNDGYPDIASINNTSNTVSFLRNKCGAFNLPPTQTFTVTLSPATGAIAIATGDFDLDGDVDIATANNTGAANNVSVLRNNWIGLGTFSFSLVGNITVGATHALRGITAADFDGDGEIDLAVTSNNSTNMYVLMGNAGGGDLTFPTTYTYTALGSGAGITSVDLDADGDKEIITVHRNAPSVVNTVSVFTNNGTLGARFSTTARIDYASATIDPYSVTTGLFNADTKPDLSVGYGTNGTIRVILNTTASANTITFNTPGTTYTPGAAAGQPLCVAPADFDGDGKIDLAAACFSGTPSLGLLVGDGAGGFSANAIPSYTFNTTNPRWIVSADFNQDGHSDVAIPNAGNANISVALNAGPYTGTIDDKMNMVYAYTSSNYNHYGYSLLQTQDGGYLIAGKSPRWGDQVGNNGSLLKTDKNGAMQWIRGYHMAADGNNNGDFRSIIQSADGHIIVAGKRNIWGGSSTYFSVMKLTACGDTIWTKVYDASAATGEYASAIVRAYTTAGADDGYLVAGNDGNQQIVLAKIDAAGTLQWSHRYSPGFNAIARSVIAIDVGDGDTYKDDGYLIVGYGQSIGSGTGKDALLIRTDASGSAQWARGYGHNSNSYDDELYAVQQLYGDNQDFIVVGYTQSISPSLGTNAALMLRIATDGTQYRTGSWQNTMYSTATIAYDVKQVDDTDADLNPDDGFIIAGTMDNYAAAVSNVFIHKTDNSCVRLWTDTIPVKKTMPTSQDDAYAIIQTTDLGFATAGRTSYYGPDNTYLIKTTSSGILAGDLNICSSANISVTVGVVDPSSLGTPSTSSATGALTQTITASPVTTYTTSSRIPAGAEICISAAMPVELMFFTSECSSDKNLVSLKWSTASETNNNYFTVEKSEDGKLFEPIGYVNGVGTSSTTRKYEFIDVDPHSPGGEGQGVRYYRLKQTDYDGKYEYFGPISARCDNADLLVFPSVSSGEFSVQSTGMSIKSVKVFNLVGALVYESAKCKLEISNCQLDLSFLPSGTYFVYAETERAVLNKKIMLNK